VPGEATASKLSPLTNTEPLIEPPDPNDKV
jgi:hypothetical protein